MDHLIGQRFNLISKSDIRYVGTLHEINPEASTIALENVISHGTEGRRNGEAEIAPSTSVYEYIVFRGSDVKDISVADDLKENKAPEPPQVPDDPAILGTGSRPPPSRSSNKDSEQSRQQHVPPPSQQQTHQPPPGYPPQPPFPYYYPPPPPGQDFGPPGRFPLGPGFQGPPHFGGPPGGPPGWFPPPGHGFQHGPGQFPPNQMPMGPGPQHPQGMQQGPPKPTSELPVDDSVRSRPASKGASPTPGPTATGPTPPMDSKPSVMEALGPIASTADAAKPAPATAPTTSIPKATPPSGPRNPRVAVPMPVPTTKPAVSTILPAINGPLQTNTGSVAPQATANQPGKSSVQDATRAATAAVAAAMAKLPPPTVQKKSQQADLSVENLTKKVGEMRTNDGNRGSRGGYRGERGSRGGFRGGRGYEQQSSKKVEVPNTDYDFESANAKFNKQDLVKEAIASGSPIHEASEVANGDGPAENINGQAVEANANTTGYNKASSFFDNISSETKDREVGSTGRVGGREWRGEEEKKNMETFGQGSVDGGYRGGYRGRGRGRGYGRGRGAFRGATRGPRGGGFRGGRGGEPSAVAQ